MKLYSFFKLKKKKKNNINVVPKFWPIVKNQPICQSGRVFTNSQGDQGSIPAQVITKSQKKKKNGS